MTGRGIRKPRWAGFAAGLFLPVALAAWAAEEPRGAVVAQSDSEAPRGTVVAEGDSEVLFEAAFPSPSLSARQAAGRAYVFVDMAGGSHAGAPGAPDLPSREWLIAVPPGAEAVVELVEADYVALAPGRPLPVAEQDLVFAGEGRGPDDAIPDFRLTYAEDPLVYDGSAPFPPLAVTAGSIRSWRHSRVLPVAIAPVRFDPGTGVLSWSPRVRVRVRFVDAPGKRPLPEGAPVLEDEGRWEPLLRGAILNYDRARAWRRKPAARAGAPALMESQRIASGAFPGSEEFRIAVDSTGVYRIAFGELTAAGLTAAALEWSALKLVVRDYADDEPDPFREIPVAYLPYTDDGDELFEPGEALLFFGQHAWDFFSLSPGDRRYGRPNVYWLIHGAGEGPRMEQRESWFGWTDLTPPLTYRRTIHFEQNRHYGEMRVASESVDVLQGPFGVTSDHYNWTNPVALFPWVKVVAYDMPPVARGVGACVHLQGQYYVNNVSGNPHRARLWLSRSSSAETASDRAFPGNPYIMASLSDRIVCDEGPIPSSVLSTGRNYLKIYVPTVNDGRDNVDADQVGVDWLEVTFDGWFQMLNGVLRAPLAGLSGHQELVLRSLPSRDAVVLDIAAARAPVALRIGAEQFTAAGNTWTLRMQVDAGEGGSPPEILAAVPASFLPLRPGALRMRTASPVVDFAGEDYILVRPRRFADAIAPLVAHRESQGHRVLDVAIEDLYDTYSGGRAHPFAIKRLMRALWRASSPAPDYLLLFGDGSNDLGSYSLGIESGQSDSVYVPTINFFGHNFSSSGTQLPSMELWFVDNLGGGWTDPLSLFPDVHLGRVPAGSPEEAAIYVEKVRRYETADLSGSWRGRMIMATDDVFSGDGLTYGRNNAGEINFESITDNSILTIERDSLFSHGEIDSFYLSAWMDSVPDLGRCIIDEETGRCLRNEDGEVVLVPLLTRIPAAANASYGENVVRPQLLDALSRGALLWAYQGHSHSRELAHERLFVNYQKGGLRDVRSLANLDKPFVFHGYGCHLGEFGSHREGGFRGDGMSEEMLLCCEDTRRAGIGAIASTDFEAIGHDFQEKVFETMFADPPADSLGQRRWRLGELVTSAKAKVSLSSWSRLERLTYTLLGDPALRHGILPPWIALALNDQPWESGAEYASGREDDSLFVAVTLTDEAAVELPEVTDYAGLVPAERLEVLATETEGRRMRLAYRTQIQRRPYSLLVRAVDYEGSARQVEVRVPFEIALWEQSGEGLEPIPLEGITAETQLAVTVRSGAHLEADDIRLLADGTPLAIVRADLEEPAGRPRTWTLRYGTLAAGQGSVVSLALEVVQRDGAALTLFERQVEVAGADLRVAEAYWMPNPFADRAHFVYRLTGDASRARLRLFTSSGKKILEEDALATSRGLQHFLWDGRDGDGDPVANGLYFYEFSIWDEAGRKVEPRVLDKVMRVR